jgi:two-component system nitrate/nitrite response regulator NarL
MDFQMPVTNGLEAAREITLLFPNTAVLMLRMYESPQLLKFAQASGTKDVISKSDAVADLLLAAMNRVCARPAKS